MTDYAYIMKNNLLVDRENYRLYNYKILNSEGRLISSQDMTIQQAVEMSNRCDADFISPATYLRLTTKYYNSVNQPENKQYVQGMITKQ